MISGYGRVPPTKGGSKSGDYTDVVELDFQLGEQKEVP
jgi:hypothetical protein